MEEINKQRLLKALLHPVSIRAGLVNIAVLLAVIIVCHLAPSWKSALTIIATAYAAYYYFVVCKSTQIVHLPDSDVARRLLAWMPCLRGLGYVPSPWLVNRHLQTLWGAFRPQDAARLGGIQREIAHGVFADGENCVLDWYRAPPHLAEKGAEEWQRDLVLGFPDGESFLDRIEHTALLRKRHPNTAAAEGRVPHKNPVIIVFHGLTSACGDPNILRLIELFNQRGWHAVIPIRRGCGDDPSLVTRPKYYAYGGLEDTALTVEHIAKSVPDHPLFAIGISAGSNVAVNYLGQQGRFSLVHGAVSVANGYCWQTGTLALLEKSPVWDVVMSALVKASMYHPHAHVISTVHTQAKNAVNSGSNNSTLDQTSQGGEDPLIHFTENMRAAARQQQQQPSAAENTKSIKAAASMREIDDLVSKNLHGFDCLEEFYAEQSCVHRLHRVKVPVIFTNAIDDPIANFGALSTDTLCCNENFLFALTPRGGHLGWAQGVFPFGSYRNTHSFMDTFSVEALTAVMAEAKHRLRHFGDFSGVSHTSHEMMTPAGSFDVPAARAAAAAATATNAGSPSSSFLSAGRQQQRLVSTPTMLVPREAALFPATTTATAQAKRSA